MEAVVDHMDTWARHQVFGGAEEQSIVHAEGEEFAERLLVEEINRPIDLGKHEGGSQPAFHFGTPDLEAFQAFGGFHHALPAVVVAPGVAMLALLGVLLDDPALLGIPIEGDGADGAGFKAASHLPSDGRAHILEVVSGALIDHVVAARTLSRLHGRGISESNGVLRFQKFEQFLLGGLNDPVVGEGLENPRSLVKPVAAFGADDPVPLTSQPFSKNLGGHLGHRRRPMGVLHRPCEAAFGALAVDRQAPGCVGGIRDGRLVLVTG